MTLRPYQSRALDDAATEHATHKRVCLVAPTGAGKSVIGREWVRQQVAASHRVLMLAHRIELVDQFAKHLAHVGVRAGIIAAGRPADPFAPVQCASLDTITARGEVPEATRILWDECHHAQADTYRPILEALPDALTLGLTATPQRADGRPLGDLFGALVVAETYPNLLAMGHLAQCLVYRPEEFLGTDFAQDPADAWIAHSQGGRGFAFCRSVEDAQKLAVTLNDRGVRAACVEGKMAAQDRDRVVAAFRAGKLDCLTNVHILTEGTDIPEASVCMLARSPRHAGTYLQMVGRVLRVHPNKRRAILIDLPGCSHEGMHGYPLADREYALEGRAIKAKGESLKNCLQCGLTVPSAMRVCGECGYEWPRRVYEGPRIWNLELVEYFETGGDLSSAPKELKRREWDRLFALSDSRGWGPGWALREFRRQLGEPPEAWVKAISEEARVIELARLREVQQTRGLKPGWISHAYKQTFGAFPSRALRERAGVEVPNPKPARLYRRARMA